MPIEDQTLTSEDSKQIPRYIIDSSGHIQKNPNYQSKSGPMPSAPPPYNPYGAKQLTTVSSIEDQIAISETTQLGAPLQFQTALNTFQSQPYVDAFETKNLDGGTLVDGLSNVFQRNEIPIGLISKLTEFKGANFHYKVDDSGSMTYDSDLLITDFCDYMKKKVGYTSKLYASRWQDAEDRLHKSIELLAYVPTGTIIVSVFDRDYPGRRITLSRRGITPEEFIVQAHNMISDFFNVQPSGDTPIYTNIKNMFDEADRTRGSSDRKTNHSLLTDGEPNGGPAEIRRIKDLLLSRNASLNPFTFLGCSNRRQDYAWMHEIEEVAPFIAAVPDFRDEQMEVYKDQGPAFPYSRGMWLLCCLAAAINPNDLDALDQHWPFSKITLENLFGRGLTESEYLSYFDNHPNARRVFGPDYNLFLKLSDSTAIPSVRLFQNTLKARLSRDIDDGDDDSEDRDVAIAEQAVLQSRRSSAAMWNNSSTGTRAYDGYQYPPPDNSACCIIL